MSFESVKFGVAGAVFIGTFCGLEDEGSGLKPLLQKSIPVGAAFAATFDVIEDVRFRVAGAAFIGTLCGLEDEGSGLKPLLQEDGCIV